MVYRIEFIPGADCSNLRVAKMAKILYADPDKKIIIKDVILPELGKNQIRVKTAYSFVSAGTELTAIQMGMPNFIAPVIERPLGYSLAGEVIEVGSNVTHVKPGDKVCCIGEGAYHATEVVVGQNLVVPIPKGISLREAAPAAMMCFAIGGVRKARLEFGENVLVVGAGAMGQLAS